MLILGSQGPSLSPYFGYETEQHSLILRLLRGGSACMHMPKHLAQISMHVNDETVCMHMAKYPAQISTHANDETACMQVCSAV